MKGFGQPNRCNREQIEVNQREDHLRIEQIEYLIEARSDELENYARPDLMAEARRHLAVCESCQRLVSMHQGCAGILRRLGEEVPNNATKDCPSEASLYELAAGVLNPEKADSVLRHIVQCDRCGPLLRQATEDLNSSETMKEDTLLLSLRTARPEWQESIALKLASLNASSLALSSSAPSIRPLARSRFMLRVPWVYAVAAGVILCAVVASWVIWRTRPSYAERLLAQAYSEQRTMELRVPGAGYGPPRSRRGAQPSRLDKPEALLEAEPLVAKNLATHPSDPNWLGAKGRIDLLEGNAEGAIDTLQRAIQLDPDSLPLKIDLASAYSERAESADRTIDFGTAVEWLGRALNQNPHDRVALFNRAVIYEKLFLYDQATQDWEHYLRIDSRGDWASEAKSRLEGLKEKIKRRDSSSLPFITDGVTASSILAPLIDVPSASLNPAQMVIEEDYLQIAILHWIPRLRWGKAKEQSEGFQQSEERALVLLSLLLKNHHSDSWMVELLHSKPSLAFSHATESLAGALTANQEGNSEEARHLASQAVRGFQISGSLAGELRARFEILYALKRAQRGPECVAAADSLVADLLNHSYSWLLIQTLLEQSNCRYMVGEFERASVATNAALKKAELSKYMTLLLRSLGFAAGLASARGDMRRSWQLDRKGLDLYWSGHFDGVRAWQFYSDMGFAAEESAEWHMALALARESVSALQSTGRHGEEARARYRLGTAASMTGQKTEAAEQFQIANRLYEGLPQTEAIRAFEADGELALAELEVNSNESERALAQLAKVNPLLPQLKSYTIPLRYYKTEGRLHYLRGEDDKAESAFHAAIVISEIGMRSLRDGADRLAWEKETSDLYRYLVELLLLHRKDPISAFQAWEWYRAAPVRRDLASNKIQTMRANRAPRFHQIPFETLDERPAVTSIKEIDVSPPQNTSLISYAWLSTGLAIWTSNKWGVHAEYISINKDSFDRVAARFVEACTRPQSDIAAIQADGKQLHQWLFAPIEHYLDHGQLLVVEADQSIALIPFQALSDATGQYLGASWPFLYSLGIGYGHLSSPAQKAVLQLHALIVGIPRGYSAEGLPPLPDALIEAQRIAGLFKSRTLLVDDKATYRAVMDGLSRAAVFHFAGHALISPKRRGLLLARRELPNSENTDDLVSLEAEEIRSAQLRHCQLIVLSACSTGRSEQPLFDPEDLVGAFLRAGVHEVVATRWNVDSAATGLMMSTFYGEMSDGRNVSVALQKAGAVLRNDPRTSHPYFWAAFNGYGNN